MENEIEMIKSHGEEGCSQNFSDFCRQDVQGVFKIANKETFFKSIPAYNPLRELATVIKTDCEYVEMPIFGEHCGWGDNPTVPTANANRSINIRLYPLFSKLRMSRSVFNKIKDFDEYIRGQLLLQLCNLEKTVLLNGVEEANPADQYAPVGLVNLINNKPTITFDNFDEWSGELSKLVCSIPSEYHHNACFVMSLNLLTRLNSLDWDDKTRIGFDGISKLLGYRFVVMDAVGDHLLFGDFKQAVVIAESEMDYIESHRDFAAPNYVGLSMPASVGIAIVNEKALVCAKCVNV